MSESSVSDSLTANQRMAFRRIAEGKTRVVDLLRDAADADEISRAALLKAIAGAHVSNNSGHIEWYTPAKYIDAARKVMGGIDLDPASCAEANKVVGADTFFDETEDGLAQQWAGRVWMNPPYASGLIDKFCTKLRDSYVAEDIDQAVVVVNNATETAWFHTLARVANAFCFPLTRINFWRSDRPSFTPLQGQAFMYFGSNVKAFRKEFGQFGFTVTP